MTRRQHWCSALLAAALVLPCSVDAADQAILGRQLVVKNPSTPDRRKIMVKAVEAGSDDTIVGDPAVDGATVAIAVDGTTPSAQTYELAGGMSALTGDAFWKGDLTRGFDYRDPRGENGPVRRARIKVVRGTFQIKLDIQARLGAVTVVPPNLGSSGCVLLSINGGDSYSMRFADGVVGNEAAKLFKVVNPTQQASCVTVAPLTLIPASFAAPVPVRAGGTPIDLQGVKAVPRVVDWNDNGALDLLVFAGDGYLWRYMALGPSTSPDFAVGVKVRDVTDADIRVGTGYTSGAFVDLDADGDADLVVAGNENRVRFYANLGSSAVPLFGSYVNLPASTGDFVLPSSSGSRIDVADWDGDGKRDLLAGDFNGVVTFYRNTGTATAPRFADPGVQLAVDGAPIVEFYNTHPRVFDLNGDGVRDLAYGVNWHYFQLLPASATFPHELESRFLARNTAGAPIDLRNANGDDASPDFADLDGDGVLDLVDGGLLGRVVVMVGRPYTDTLTRIDEIMAAHPTDLGATLAANVPLREELFGLHHQLREFAGVLKPAGSARAAIRDWYASHLAAYPQYLPWQMLDKDAQAFIPVLAGQCWINLFESVPDTPAHRSFVASACGFTGWQAQLVIDAGTVFVENRSSSEAQQKALYDLQMSLPTEYRVVESVTAADWLYPAGASNPPAISARTGVNIFNYPIGAYAEGFPPDVPQVLIDTYCVAIAHELNHNVEAPATKLFPTWYRQRKSELLKQAAPPDYQWITNPDGAYAWDESATKTVFLSSGYWDGVDSHWEAALDAYWSTGPGSGYDQHWCRDNLRFSIKNPQEAFATLANQYFDSSETMLDLGLVRFAAGNPWCLNQVLWFAEVYAVGGSTTAFYRVDTAGTVTRTDVAIERSPTDHIDGITLPGGTHHSFTTAANGDVLAVGP